MEYALYISLILFGLFAVFLNVFSIPGNWLMLLAAVIVSATTHWLAPSPEWLVIMLFLLLFGELVEFLAGAVVARQFGASKAGALLAIPGGIVGAFIGLMLPIPLFGPVIGAIVGSAIAVLIVELMRARTVSHSFWAALGAGLGRLIGLGGKLLVGLAVWVMLIVTAIP